MAPLMLVMLLVKLPSMEWDLLNLSCVGWA